MDPNVVALLQFDEISHMLSVAEEETRQYELELEHESYLKELEKETEALVALHECKICKKETYNLICTDCTNFLNLPD